MSFEETVFVLDRSQAPETSDGGATLRATLSPPLKLAPHKRHAVYLDQLSAVASFNNISPSLHNDQIALAPVDPALWEWAATVSQSFQISYSYAPAQTITVNAGTGTLTELSQAINAELTGGLQLSIVPKAKGAHLYTLRDSGGSDVSAYMSPSPAQLSQLITLRPRPASGNVTKHTIARGNYGLTEAKITDAINAIAVPAGEHFAITLSLDDATNRLKITPDAQNTMTLLLDQSTLFTAFLGFRATQGYLQAAAASGTVAGLTLHGSLTNLDSAQFDAFSTIQVHTPLAYSFGPDGQPSTAIAQTLVDVAAGRAFNYHPPRALLVPASPGFSTDSIQVSLRTPSGKFVDTDENWSVVIVVRTFD
jgi:hypothetical protein